MSNTVHTITGRRVDINDPSPSQIRVQDIARALGMTARWGGHLLGFYSVAEHAVLVAGIVWHQEHDPRLALAALHHDAHEAYLGDLITPIKQMVAGWETLELRVDEAICTAVGYITPADMRDERVKAADRLALEAEDTALRGGQVFQNDGIVRDINSWVGVFPRHLDPRRAADVYMARHIEFVHKIEARGG